MTCASLCLMVQAVVWVTPRRRASSMLEMPCLLCVTWYMARNQVRSGGGTGPISCSCRPPPRPPARPLSRPLRGTPRRRAAMQVAAYARVSSRRPAQARSIEQQLDRLRAHAAARGWELAQEHVFRDDGYSGASLGRPGLDRLRDAAAGARLDHILIAAPDRLARNYGTVRQ